MKKACVWVCLCCRTWMLTCGIPTRIWLRSHSRVWSSIVSGGRRNRFILSLTASFLQFLVDVHSDSSHVCRHVRQRQEMTVLLRRNECGPNPSFTSLTEGPRNSAGGWGDSERSLQLNLCIYVHISFIVHRLRGEATESLLATYGQIMEWNQSIV